MADQQFKVKVGDAEYLVKAPNANVAWQWANMTHQDITANKPAPEAPVPQAAQQSAAPPVEAGQPFGDAVKQMQARLPAVEKRVAELQAVVTAQEQAAKAAGKQYAPSTNERRALYEAKMQRDSILGNIADVEKARGLIQTRGAYGTEETSSAFGRGIGQLQSIYGAGRAMFGGDEEKAARDIVAGQAKAVQSARTPEEQAAYEEFQAAPSIWESIKVLAKNPGLLVDLPVESLPASAPSLALGIAGGIAGGAAGNVPGALIGARGGATLGTALGSFATEYGSTLLNIMAESGVDINNPEQVEAAINNPELMSTAREVGLKRGIPIAIFDALSVKLAGKLGGAQTMRRLAPEGATKLRTVTAGAIGAVPETLAQGALGGAGEAAAQLVSEGKISSPSSIVGEFAGELLPGAAEAVVGTAYEAATTKTPKAVDNEAKDLQDIYAGLFQQRVDAIIASQPGLAMPEAAALAEQETPQILQQAQETLIDRYVTAARANIPEGGFDDETLDDAFYRIESDLGNNQELYGVAPDELPFELKQRAAETLAANPDLSINAALNEASRFVSSQAQGTQAAPAAEAAPTTLEPEPTPGFVRVYHSGSQGEGETGRWVSTNRNYAANYRPDLPLYYTDIPADDPRVNNPDYADQGVGQGFTFNFELTPEEATRLQEIPRETQGETQTTPTTKEAPAPKPTELADTSVDLVDEATSELTPEFTPQDVLNNLDSYARSEAQDRDLEPSIFTDAARDAVEGRALETDEEIADAFGPDNVDTYKAGIQWGQDRASEAQPAAEQAAPEVQEEMKFTPEIAPESDQKTNTETEKLITQLFPEGPPPKPTQPSFLNIGPTVGSRIENMVATLSRVPSLSRGVQKLLAYYQSGFLSAEQFVEEIEALNEYVARMRNVKQYRKATTPRVRGADFIRQKILEAKRRDIISPEGADFTEWFILQNPDLVDDLGIAIRKLPKNGNARGEYNPIARLMILFKEAVDDITPVHEILHHLERLMPVNIQNAIRTSWINATKRAAKRAATEQEKTYFDALRAYHNNEELTVNGETYSPEAARNLAIYMISNGMVPFGHYQYFDASEFWTVNATDIVAGRFDVRGSVLGRLKQWLRELEQKIRGALGLPSQAPILRALRSLSRADGAYQSNEMLGGMEGPLLSPEGPKVTPDQVIAANPKLTQAQIDSALRAAGLKEEKISGFEKKILRSTTSTQMNSSIPGLIAAARSFKDALQLAKAIRESISPAVLRNILPFCTNNFVIRWAEDRIPALRGIENVLDKMDAYRNKAFQVVDEQVSKWADFSKKFRATAKMLEDVIMLANFYGVDPTQARSAQAYIEIDGEMKRLNEKYNAEGADKEAVQRLINARKRQIARVYNGSADKVGNAVAGWNTLMGARGALQARQIFIMARDAYKKSFDEYYNGYLNRVNAMGLTEENAAKARVAVERLFAPVKANPIYFPLMRFGDFWLVVGKGANREFYTFESAVARNVFREKLAAQNPDIYLNQGDNIQKLRDEMLDNDPAATAVKEVLDALGKDNPNMDILKDQLFQMYLMTLPNSDLRQRFAHRKFTTGFSTDALRVFSAMQRSAASQIARFVYAPEIDTAVSEARDQLKNYSPAEKTKLETFVDTMEDRAQREVAPSEGGFWDTFTRYGTKAVFIYMLAGISNAVVEFSQILYMIPYLMENYSIPQVTAKFLKYTAGMIPFGGFTFKRYYNDGKLISRFNLPSMKDSYQFKRLAKTDPARAEDMLYGWEQGALSGLYSQTFMGDSDAVARMPSEELGVLEALKRGDLASAGMQATTFGINLMSAPYRALSSMSKQIGFMVSYELAYEKALKQGKSREEARELASVEALGSARDVLLARPERDMPPMLKAPVARLGAQFTMFQYRYLALMYRPLIRMLRKDVDFRTRLGAAKAFFGTSILAGSLYGTTGFAGYGLAIAMLEALRDDDDEDRKRDDNDPQNPLNSIDLDAWYREVWLPETFGPDGNFASVLKLEPETAELIQKSAEFGALSAATGVNFYSSLSLGKFWTNDAIKGSTDSAKLKEAFFNYVAGPAGSMVDNMVQGIDLIQKGDTRRGMEAIVPKGIRGFIKEQRFAEEGVLTKDRKEVFKKTYLTPTKKVLTALGFNDLEISMIQEQNYRVSRWEKRVEARKADLLAKYKFAADEALRTNYAPEETAKLRAIKAKMDKFDADFPAYSFDFDEILEGDWQRMQDRAGSQQGLPEDIKLPVGQRILAKRAQKALEAAQKEAQ